MTCVSLRPAQESDIAFIMDCERGPGYAPLVGRWPADQHRTTMAEPDFHYLIGSDESGTARGFAIVRENFLGFPNCYLKRIAVRDTGAGFGKPFTAALCDWVFTQTKTHRFWLEVVEANTRAIHVYHAQGFVDEGRVREAFVDPDGSRGSYLLMSILKPEWQARRA